MPIPRTDVDCAPQAAVRATLEGDDIFFGRQQEGDYQVRWRVANMGPVLPLARRELWAMAPVPVTFSRAAHRDYMVLRFSNSPRRSKGPYKLIGLLLRLGVIPLL